MSHHILKIVRLCGRKQKKKRKNMAISAQLNFNTSKTVYWVYIKLILQFKGRKINIYKHAFAEFRKATNQRIGITFGVQF